MSLKISSITEKQLRLLKLMQKRKITAREQDVYSVFAFYINIGTLKRYGLVIEDGLSPSDNGRKMWIITDHGKKLVNYMQKAEEVLSNGEKMVLATEHRE